MAQQTIVNGETGLVTRTKLNENFTELYSASPDDEKVKISSADTTSNYLENKIQGVSGKTSVTKLNAGSNESLQIGIGVDIFDTTSNDMDDITDGATYVKTENNLTDALKTSYDGAVTDSHCFSEDTRILTIDGFKNYWDIEIGDYIINLNTETMELEYDIINEKFVYNYNDKMLRFNNRATDLLVDPKHGLIHLTKKGNLILNTAENFYNDIKSNIKRTFINSGILKREGLDLSDNEIKLLVWICADGYITKSNSISFHFRKQRKIDEIENLLNKMNLKYSKRIQYKELNDTQILVLKNEYIDLLISNYFKNGKKLPKEFLNLNKHQTDLLVETYLKSDGYKYKSNKYNYSCGAIYTNKEEEMDILVALLPINGYRVSLGKNKKTYLNISKRSKCDFGLESNLEKIEYSGKIFCFSVNNKTLISERNGKVVITQNSQNTDTGTNQNTFTIGDNTDTTKTIEADNGDANNPAIRYNSSTNVWELANDGTTFNEIGTASGGATVKVSSNDTTSGYLEDKIVVSSGTNTTNILEVSTLNDGGDEDLQIQIDEAKVDHDNLTGIDAVASGVTYGHVSDQPETVYGSKILNDGGCVAFDKEFKLGVNNVSSNIYAWYHCNTGSGSSLIDSSGNGYNGAFNGAVWETSLQKLGTACLEFNANNQYILFDSVPAGTFDFDFDDAFSFEAWVRLDDTASANRVILSKGTSSVGYQFYIKGNGNPEIELNVNGASRKLLKECTFNFESSLTNWHHIVMTYDGSESVGGIKIYVDNTELTSANTVDTYQAGDTMIVTQDFQISGVNGNNNCFDTGYIDEVVIYDKELTTGEISLRYNSGSGTQDIGVSGNIFTMTNELANNKMVATFGGLPNEFVFNKDGSLEVLTSIDTAAYKVGGTSGASGSFTAQSGETVTVSNGIITSIV